ARAQLSAAAVNIAKAESLTVDDFLRVIGFRRVRPLGTRSPLALDAFLRFGSDYSSAQKKGNLKNCQCSDGGPTPQGDQRVLALTLFIGETYGTSLEASSGRNRARTH